VHADALRIERLTWFLEAHFGEVELHIPEPHVDGDGDGMKQSENFTNKPWLLVRLDDVEASINLVDMVSIYQLLVPCFFKGVDIAYL
jgi:cleavage and polyadenylation specificity factor subunit 3